MELNHHNILDDVVEVALLFHDESLDHFLKSVVLHGRKFDMGLANLSLPIIDFVYQYTTNNLVL